MKKMYVDSHSKVRWQRCVRVIAVLLATVAVSFGSIQLSGGGASASEPVATLNSVTIPVEGMVCVSCAAAVKRAVKSMSGVTDVEVSLTQRTVTVSFASDQVTADRIVASIKALGYRAGKPRSE